MANLRSAEDTLTAAVAQTIDSLALDDVDSGAVELARHYAEAIDAGHCAECDADTSLDVLGPKLQAALDALGASPAARARIGKGGVQSAGTNRLGALREARRAG